MADIVSKEKRSQMMAGIKAINTKPELIIRSILYKAGYRYRLHKKELPGKPDLILGKYKVAIFINGCFWHGHSSCKLFKLPGTNTDFWKSKIEGTVERDKKAILALNELGWRTIIIWECYIRENQKVESSFFLKTFKDWLSSDSINHEI